MSKLFLFGFISLLSCTITILPMVKRHDLNSYSKYITAFDKITATRIAANYYSLNREKSQHIRCKEMNLIDHNAFNTLIVRGPKKVFKELEQEYITQNKARILAQQVLASINSKHDENLENKDVQGNIDCAICFEKINLVELFITSCGHKFDITCLIQWASSQDSKSLPRTCPMCNQSLANDEIALK